MKYNTIILQVSILFLCALINISCSDLDVLHGIEIENNQTCVYSMHLECNSPSYDGVGTRANTSWSDGSTIYLNFGMATGIAIYSATNDVWTVTTSAPLNTKNSEQTFIAYYFENVNTKNENIIDLSENAICYQGSGTYTYSSYSNISAKALLKPTTWRIHFKGSPNTETSILSTNTDIKYYTSFDNSSGLFSTTSKTLNLITDNSGYTPYIYGVFVNNLSNLLTVKTDNIYSRKIDATNLQPGESGVITIPTVSNYVSEGWTRMDSNIAYYLIGGPGGWNAEAALTMQFLHSSKDVLDDPVFTYTFASNNNDIWFAFGDKDAIDAVAEGNWTKLFGTTGESEDLTGTFDRRYNLNGDHSFHLDGSAKYYRIQINVVEMTYKITPMDNAE